MIRMDKLWHIHAVKYYKVMEMNKLLLCTRSWSNKDNAERRRLDRKAYVLYDFIYIKL